MTIVKRLRLLTAVLGTAAATAVIGTTVFGDFRAARTNSPESVVAKKATTLGEDPRTRYSSQPALTYKNRAGVTSFAWQVKSTQTQSVARDRDVIVLVDTSASQAGAPLKRARHILDGLSTTIGTNDRMDVWTINLNDPKATRSLSGGLKGAKSFEVANASAQLVETEFAAGATDLKAGLESVLKNFDVNPGRHQVILFLGDGESAASAEPLNELARVELGGKLEAQNLSFFAVPLGIKVNSHNLHGLASLTGGTVVRVSEDVDTAKGRADFATKLVTAFNVPVFKPTKVQYGEGIAETFPARLPPLRSDRSTLVVGTLKGEVASLTAKIEGTIAGQPVVMELAERVPTEQGDNYFVHAMIEQWRTASTKDSPAILAGDRALGLAAQQFRLFREEFLSQAVYAISSDKLDHAEKLYQAATKIDPMNSEAAAGLSVIEKLRTGKLTREKMRAGLKTEQARVNLANLAQAPAPPAGAGAPPAAPDTAAAASALQLAQAERAVQEGQFRVLVDETIRRARQLLPIDPDTAYEDLKRQADTVRSNPQLSEAFRNRLVSDLQAMMQTVQTQGAAIKRNLAEERERIASARLRVNEFARQENLEEQTRARIDAFKQLMNQARYEEAQREAQVLIQGRASRGLVIPPEAIASYMIGQAATNLREHRELVRLREDRYLLTMLQVEKSFIPYPDEPPVHFPPAAVWRELTADRTKYQSATLGPDVSQSMRRTMSIIEGPTAQRVRIEQDLDGIPLKDFLSLMEKDHDLKFVVLEDEFKTAGRQAILDEKLPLKQRLYGLTVGPALDIALQSIGATYVVRPEYIEITTIDKRLTEKVVRAFDVAELVFEIPSSVNQATLFQNQNVQAQNLQLFGQATFAGGFGAIGGLGVGGGFNAIGGLGGGGLGGQGGGGGLGGAAGNPGGFGGGAANNLGAGGGVTGVGGGQMGQFGNLGGQFGIQGNSLVNYQQLITLITEVVARGEWANVNQQFQVATPNGEPSEEQQKILPENQLNSIAFYPPARALIIRATGKYHPQSSIKLKKPEGGALGGPGNPARGGNAVAQAPAAPNKAVAVKADGKDPLRMWQQAMTDSNVRDPGMVIACADFLFDANEPLHAAEILKSGIREGLTTDTWAHESLALALSASKASAFEVQRVGLSSLDLEPDNAKAYLKAAKVADQNGMPKMAFAYCQRAASLEPNLPAVYANALDYAGKGEVVQTDALSWATENLLSRDWTTADGIDYHDQTKARLATIVEKFEKNNQPEQVALFKKALEHDKQRDLVIELLWQGQADLDLIVTEPTASVASSTTKRTTGGGVLKADVLEQQNDRSEIYTAASAFSGKYAISVKTILGTPIGQTAKVKVTKFKGTDRESFEFYSLDLTAPKPLTIEMENGSRTALASIPADQLTDARLQTTGAPVTTNKSFGGGLGAAGSDTSSVISTNSNLPVVVQPLETKLVGVTPSAPGMRAVMDVSPDRSKVTISANPIFNGIAADIKLPSVSLLPGSDSVR